jgi:hypothetical protein
MQFQRCSGRVWVKAAEQWEGNVMKLWRNLAKVKIAGESKWNGYGWWGWGYSAVRPLST